MPPGTGTLVQRPPPTALISGVATMVFGIGDIPMGVECCLARTYAHGQCEVKRRSESGHHVRGEQRSQCQSKRKSTTCTGRKSYSRWCVRCLSICFEAPVFPKKRALQRTPRLFHLRFIVVYCAWKSWQTDSTKERSRMNVGPYAGVYTVLIG